MAEREKRIYRTTILGSICNLLLMLFKLLAGILGHSAAIVADAVHSLSDFITDIIVIVFVRIAGKPQDEEHDYGHGKFETLATAIVGMVLFAVGIGILYGGAKAIWNVAHGLAIPTPGKVALWAAGVSIVLKELLFHYTIRVGRRVDSNALKANAWHHRSDALSSVGTFIGIGGAILLGERWVILDPVAAVVVSFFILRAAWQITKPCLDELLEKSLPKEVEDKIISALLEVNPNCRPHNLRTRRIGTRCAVDVHVLMDAQMTVQDSHNQTRLMEQHIRHAIGPTPFISIHVEPLSAEPTAVRPPVQPK